MNHHKASHSSVASSLIAFSALAFSSCREELSSAPESLQTSPSNSQNKPRLAENASPALPISSDWSPLIPRERRAQFRDIIETALTLVRTFPPAEDNLFHWKGAPLSNKEFQIYFSTSKDPLVAECNRQVPGGVPENTDAFTISVKIKDSKGTTIITALLLDRLFYLNNGLERPDALARATVVLAHEIYGNVGEALSRTTEQMTPQTFASRKSSEIHAFQAGIDFIRRLQSDPLFKQLSTKVQADFEYLLLVEQQGLKSWQK